MTDDRETIALAECPIGLFRSASGELCLKTEYGSNEGRIDAYIVSSGEFFWGGTGKAKDQRQVLVTPVDAAAIAPVSADPAGVALAEKIDTALHACAWTNGAFLEDAEWSLIINSLRAAGQDVSGPGAVVAGILVGGNHLANILIGSLGADFAEKYPPDMDTETALRRLHATTEYDVWCCWAAIMRARDATLTPPAIAPGGAAGADEYGSREGFLAGEWEGPERGGAALTTSGPSRGPSSTAAGAVSVEEVERLARKAVELRGSAAFDGYGKDFEHPKVKAAYEAANVAYSDLIAAIRRIAAPQAKDGVREAAPDLLEALFRLKSECEIEGLQSKPGFDCWVSMANEALAKAGRSDMAATRSAARALKSPTNPEKPGLAGEGVPGAGDRRIGGLVRPDWHGKPDTRGLAFWNARLGVWQGGVPEPLPSPAPQHDGKPEVGA